MNRHAFFWLSAVLLTCVTGCVPGITWLPDSSGFVCMAGHNGEKLVHYRRGLVRRFPYAVFYEYTNDAMTVYCVFHTSRDPEKWRQRLSG
jgi:hypothetical protein